VEWPILCSVAGGIGRPAKRTGDTVRVTDYIVREIDAHGDCHNSECWPDLSNARHDFERTLVESRGAGPATDGVVLSRETYTLNRDGLRTSYRWTVLDTKGRMHGWEHDGQQ